MSVWLAVLSLSQIPTPPGMPAGLEVPVLGWADVDRDGLADAYVVRAGACDRLLHNLGHGAFTEVTAEALHGEPHSRSAAFADLDGDGWVDLARIDDAGELQLLRNERAFAFADVTRAAGAAGLRGLERVRCDDFDQDGRPDLELSGARHLLVLHNGGDGTFTPVPELCDEGEASSVSRLVLAAVPAAAESGVHGAAPPPARERGQRDAPSSSSAPRAPSRSSAAPLALAPPDTAAVRLAHASGPVPTGYCILGEAPVAPRGYSATGRTLATQEGESWSAGADMPLARKEFQAVALDGKVYAPGGRDESFQVLDSMVRYDPASDSWSTCANMPRPRWSFCAAALAGRIVLIGGSSATASVLEVDAYDPLGDSWTQLAQPSLWRGFPAAAVLDGKLYLCGGNASSIVTTSLEVYDPLTDAWSAGAPMPVGRMFHTATAVGGRLYVVGGSAGSPADMSVDVYDPQTDSWSSGVPMPSGRALHSAFELNGSLYVLGGSTPGGFTATVLEFLPAQGAWLTRAPMSQTRVVFGAAVVNGRAHAFGGNPSPVLASLEVYDPGVLYAFRKD